MEQTTNTNLREVRIDVASQLNNTKTVNRNILDDLAPYEFSDDIKYRANTIFKNMNHTSRRAKKRTLLLFFCVYNAYKELKIDVLPADLGKIFGLKHGEMQKTVSMFNYTQTGYRPLIRTISILDYIPDYCEKIGLDDDHTSRVIQAAEKLIDKTKGLSQFVPQTAAAGFIKLYLNDNGIELADKNLLSKVTGRSETTIDTMYKRLCEVDN